MWSKGRVLAAVAVAVVLTVVATMGVMAKLNICLGDKAFVSRAEFEQMKAMTEKYGVVEEFYDFLKTNYYKDLDDSDLITGIYKGLFEGTGDPYTRYLTKEEYDAMDESLSGEFEGIGVVVTVEDGRIRVISVVEASPAEKAGILAGDIIAAVDDKPYDGSCFDEAVANMRGEAGTKVNVTVTREGKNMSFDIIRAPIENPSVSSEVIDDNIGYIEITTFAETTADEFEKALKDLESRNVDGLVVDLRANGGGLVDQSVKVADMLMDEGTVIYTEDGRGEKTYYTSEKGRTKLDYVLLVDGGTASASEILTAGVQGNKEGIVVGTKTYGKGITQNMWKLKDGSGMKITTTQYFAPDGSVIHEKGITPDKVVEFEKTEYKDGKPVNDNQLDAALSILKGSKK